MKRTRCEKENLQVLNNPDKNFARWINKWMQKRIKEFKQWEWRSQKATRIF